MNVTKIEKADDLGKQHGRELELMLAGNKPFSAFSYYEGASQKDVLEGQDFNKYVQGGRIIRENVKYDGKNGKVNYILFSVVGEEWRIHAFKVLIEFMHTRSWSLELDWIEARIYGLPPEVCDLIVKTKAATRDRGG